MVHILRAEISRELSQVCSLSEADIFGLLEISKTIDKGHICFPTFRLAKEAKKSPPVLAQEISAALTKSHLGDNIARIEPAGGYVNFFFRDDYLQNILMEHLKKGYHNLGVNNIGLGKVMVIDYASPNVAKPMHVGHFRATVVGQSIKNLAATQGYKVIGVNHLGDWGVQFGKLAWAYQKWGSEYDFEKNPIDSLVKLYVRFHDEAEKDPKLEALGSLEFKKLEDGDKEVEKIWKYFLDISLKDFQRLWNLLGVKHDLVLGESFYSDKTADVEERLKRSNLLEESEGAMVVKLEEFGYPPCLIRKSDGATLYATRDLATAIYRREILKADLNLYVVGVDQTLHFNQVFSVLKKMGYKWADGLHHIAFGMYRFKDIGKMSTRKGTVVYFEDVVTKAIELVENIISQKNPDLENKKEIAKKIGIGAIIFNDLFNDRVKNVDFDWEKVLDFNGASGPFVQYVYVRCQSLISKSKLNCNHQMDKELKSNEERELIKILLNFDDTVANAFKYFKPHILAGYLIETAKAFNHFYQTQKILSGDSELLKSRIELVQATQMVIKRGLELLNIKCPEAM